MFVEENMGRPKNRWFDVIENDMKRASINEKDEGNRVGWKLRTKMTNLK